jgi:hypothetical protein
MAGEIDTANLFFVAAAGGGSGRVAVLRPPAPGKIIERQEALLLAAYLVSLADPLGEQFPKVLEAVQNT